MLGIDRQPRGQRMTDAIVYKLCSLGEWAAAEVSKRYVGSKLDRADGFIHFSTAAQVQETANKHFRGQAELVLVAIDADMLGDKLVFEPSRGGDLFPHLYAELDLAAVLWVRPVVMKADGTQRLPELGV
jgi:uncharacterized protein (DUF952 family)